MKVNEAKTGDKIELDDQSVWLVEKHTPEETIVTCPNCKTGLKLSPDYKVKQWKPVNKRRKKKW